MFLKSNLLMNVHVKDGLFYLINSRHFRSSKLIFEENEAHHGANRKPKITVIERKIVGSEQRLIESKRASDVIKKLNWEYKYLYGPTVSSKTKSLNLDKISESHEIIQHETQIPIIDPVVDSFKVNKISDTCNIKDKIDFSTILSFPLLNKSPQSSNKIHEFNYLRKHLEFLSKRSVVPSVSQVLQTTMPKERVEILDKWKQNMISQMGEEGFEKYHTEMLANGISLHHSITSLLSSTPESELHIKKENIGHWKSLEFVFPNIKEVKLLEEFVTHPFLCYRGVVDCFAKYKNNLVVIDWKTSKKSKAQLKNTYDDPLQIAAYVGALNFDQKFQYLVSKGLIVIAYENGMPATVHYLNDSTLKHYWNEWLMRVKQYWESKHSELEASKSL